MKRLLYILGLLLFFNQLNAQNAFNLNCNSPFYFGDAKTHDFSGSLITLEKILEKDTGVFCRVLSSSRVIQLTKKDSFITIETFSFKHFKKDKSIQQYEYAQYKHYWCKLHQDGVYYRINSKGDTLNKGYYKEGQPHGPQFRTHDIEYTYFQVDSLYRYYNMDNGLMSGEFKCYLGSNLFITGSYLHGYKYGTWTYYYPNGNKMAEGEYSNQFEKDTILTESTLFPGLQAPHFVSYSLKKGIWTYYNNKGKKVYSIDYDDNKSKKSPPKKTEELIVYIRKFEYVLIP